MQDNEHRKKQSRDSTSGVLGRRRSQPADGERAGCMDPKEGIRRPQRPSGCKSNKGNTQTLTLCPSFQNHVSTIKYKYIHMIYYTLVPAQTYLLRMLYILVIRRARTLTNVY